MATRKQLTERTVKKARKVEASSGFDDLFGDSQIFSNATTRGDLSFFEKAIDDFFWQLNTDKEYNEETYGGEREQGFHPSGIHNMKCMRRGVLEYYGVKGDSDKTDVSPQLRRIFDNGHDLHDRWQRYFTMMSDTREDIQFIGNWKCKGCGTTTDVNKEIKKPKHKCPKCGSERWKYNEFRLRDPKLRITGKRDGKFIFNGKSFILEVKSINGMQFAKLVAPKEDHLVQANIYMRLDGSPYTIFLYECKNTQSIKVYLSSKDESKIAKHIALLKDMNKYVDKGTVPPRISGFPVAGECAGCPYYQGCKRNDTFSKELKEIEKKKENKDGKNKIAKGTERRDRDSVQGKGNKRPKEKKG